MVARRKMRELRDSLKFRAYIKPLKRYAEKYETILYHHQCNMEPSWTVNISPEEYYGDGDLVIEQFTGLLDKNGKEVYEGDLVEVEDVGRFEVKWYDEIASFLFKPNMQMKYHPPFNSYQMSVCEVIGNAQENPELLKENEDGDKN